ncbi:MAG: hypothetical protein IBX60_02810 [Candidatus Aminicenantes bacterium]|nr:hypothetical protein [Candidatus Aminicenantes bacterium]
MNWNFKEKNKFEEFLSRPEVSIPSTINTKLEKQENCKTNKQQNNNSKTVLSNFYNVNKGWGWHS